MDQSPEYREINSAEDVKLYDEAVAEFHDGIVKEIAILNPSYVREDFSMIFGNLPTVRFLIQTQSAKWAATEIIFIGCSTVSLYFDHPSYTYTSVIEWTEEGVKLTIDEGTFVFVASRAKWRLVPEWIGPDVRFTTWPSFVLTAPPDQPGPSIGAPLPGLPPI
ncbi:MAG TPA: hypothetical protein VGL56_08895 [Fimbriimonadaceae bacterium]|jgi:hypothetical protein